MKKTNGILMLVASLLAVAALAQVKSQLSRPAMADRLVADASQPGG